MTNNNEAVLREALDVADFIDRKAESYLVHNAETENDTGALIFHYGEAGRDYHSSLVELAEEIRALAATATVATSTAHGDTSTANLNSSTATVAKEGGSAWCAQEFLNWNRSQKVPPVAISKELGVAEKVMELAALYPPTPQPEASAEQPTGKILQWAALNMQGQIVYQHTRRDNVEMNAPYIKTPTRIVGLIAAPISEDTGDKRTLDQQWRLDDINRATRQAPATGSIAPRRPHGTLAPEADEFVRLMSAWRMADVGDASIAAFNAVCSYIDTRAAASRNAGVSGLAPKEPGEFHSFQNWVNKAQSWLKSPSHKPAICIDAKNRRCFIGADFMRARDEGTFPVRYFWDFEEATTTPDTSARDAALEEAAMEICTLARRYSADYSTAVTDAVNAIRALKSSPAPADSSSAAPSDAERALKEIAEQLEINGFSMAEGDFVQGNLKTIRKALAAPSPTGESLSKLQRELKAARTLSDERYRTILELRAQLAPTVPGEPT